MHKETATRFFSKLGGALSGDRLLILAAAFAFAAPAFAQFGPPAGSSQGTQATQLPLSGRSTPTNGSAKTSDQPAPSTTATVNTLSPNVQMQGTYAGSTPGPGAKPLEGKLGLRDAIERGIAYYLGQTGATQTLRQ